MAFINKWIYRCIGYIAKIHNYILKMNDKYEANFTDKELHFLVVGLFGMALVLFLYPIVRYLAKKERYMTLTGTFVFVALLGFTLAIEIGQQISGTGDMDLKDILSGMQGFLVFFSIFAIFWLLYKYLRKRS